LMANDNNIERTRNAYRFTILLFFIFSDLPVVLRCRYLKS
jgi:hypothetical protein